MEYIIDLIGLVFFIILLYSFVNKETMVCTDKKCNGTMKSFIYIGDGDGPAPDHLHFKCDKCGKEEQILQ